MFLSRSVGRRDLGQAMDLEQWNDDELAYVYNEELLAGNPSLKSKYQQYRDGRETIGGGTIAEGLRSSYQSVPFTNKINSPPEQKIIQINKQGE